MPSDFDNMVLLATSESENFAREVYNCAQDMLKPMGAGLLPLGFVKGVYFPNREIYPQVGGDPNVNRFNVYFFHHFLGYNGGFDPNIGFMKLYLIDEALRNSTPAEINYILPYIPYTRQDRIDRPRVPISAKRVLQMLHVPETSIRTRVMTFDVHAEQVQGFVNYPLRNLFAEGLFEDFFRENVGLTNVTFVDVEREKPTTEHEVNVCNEQLRHEPTIVSPDTGGATRARRYAKRFNANIAIIDKRRTGPGQSDVMHLVGADYVKGRTAIIMDDLLDTGGTVIGGMNALTDAGAADVYASCVHGLFSQKDGIPTEDKIRRSGLKVVTTNTIPKGRSYLEENSDWLTVISVCKKTAAAMIAAQKLGGSVSKLFTERGELERNDFKPPS